jgi:protocatechuate 3,4-dioxygenase, beta subunit
MITKTNFIFLVIFNLLFLSCNGQTASNSTNTLNKSGVVGGPFENGEFMYIGMPSTIKSIDTSAAWTQKGQKLLVTGTIYKLNGKTPAPDVILYYYHTDIKGLLYTTKK